MYVLLTVHIENQHDHYSSFFFIPSNFFFLLAFMANELTSVRTSGGGGGGAAAVMETVARLIPHKMVICVCLRYIGILYRYSNYANLVINVDAVPSGGRAGISASRKLLDADGKYAFFSLFS